MRPRRFPSAITAAFGLLTLTSYAAPTVLSQRDVAAQYDQRTWTHQDGLPDDRVTAILQTSDGYLWAATPHGLARFDGKTFTVFDHLNTPGFVEDDCLSLAEDSQTNLWISTRYHLFRKTGDQFTRITKEQGIGHQGGLFLHADKSGNVWAYRDCWFCEIRKDGAIKSYFCDQPVRHEPVMAVCEESPGIAWLATLHGLFRFQSSEERFEPVPTGGELSNAPALGCCQTRDGARWVLFATAVPNLEATGKTFWLGGYKNGRWTATSALPVEELCWKGPFLVADASGALWLPGSQNGLLQFFGGQFRFVPMPHSGERDFAICACCDRQGNLWVGTENSGLQRWNPRRFINFTQREGLADNNVWTVAEARDGSVLVGTDGGVTRLKNGEANSLVSSKPAAESLVRSVVEDHNASVWVGTIRTLLHIQNGIESEYRLPGKWDETKIRVLLPDRGGALWIGTVHGLTRLEDGRQTKYTSADGLGSEEVRALLEDNQGDLWIGTLGGGLSRLHDGRFTSLTITNGLSSNDVWALLQDPEGTLWIGTENGLNRLKDGILTAFTTAQGLPANQVNCLLEDDFGRLWIGWDHGIYWIAKQQFDDLANHRSDSLVAVRYDQSDGLLSTETNGQKSNPAACKTRDGRLWFPTTKGVAVIDPATVVTDDVPPQTIIEQVRANGEIVQGNTPADSKAMRAEGRSATSPVLNLPPGGARVLEFRYTAGDFVAPEKTRFRYRLIGLDSHWIEAENRREAYFTDLQPGDYQFEVSAAGHHGVWQPHGAVVAFHLAPFYYQAWWFYPAGLGMTAALMIAFGLWRASEVRKIHRLEGINALNEQRKQIARDIHDELGASLTHILQISDQTRKNLKRPEKVAADAERIAVIAEEAVDNISEIVWANNPGYDTLEDLVAYLREYAANLFKEAPITVRLSFPECVPSRAVSGVFRRHLLLLAKEALQNVIKHAGATLVQVRLVLAPDCLQLRITDNGRGLEEPSPGASGNGLPNMRHRVCALKGSLEIKSHPGEGTEIQVLVPWP